MEISEAIKNNCSLTELNLGGYKTKQCERIEMDGEVQDK